MKDLVRSFAAIAVAALLFAGCEGNITEPLSPEAGISEGVAVSQQNCAITVPSSNHSTIQSAVDAADPGDNVCVDGGTYTEQVVIDKGLTLTGINDPAIEAPESPKQFTIPESATSTWEPVIFAFGGSESGGDVTGEGTVDVSISGFTVDGQDQIEGARKVGIFLRNVQSKGAIANNTVKNMGVGGTETFGILAYGDTEVAITDNIVDGYERGGIGANGDGGAHPSPEVVIANNEITGSTGIGKSWGPNGIQVGYGASGKVTDNVVRDNRYSTSGGVASCILIFESDKVSVKRNSVSNCDAGLAVGTWGWFRSSADGNELSRNEVSDALFGISMEAVAFGASFTDPLLTNNKVINNELNHGDIGDPDAETVGIEIVEYIVLDEEGEPTTDYEPIASNNKLINNTISGFEEDVVEDGSDTKVQANEPATP